MRLVRETKEEHQPFALLYCFHLDHKIKMCLFSVGPIVLPALQSELSTITLI